MFSQPFFIPALLIFLLSIPLIGGIIPPNRGYGIRTAKTMSDPQLWYRANKFGGWALLFASGIYLAMVLLVPYPPSAREDFLTWLSHLAIFVLPLLVSLFVIRMYIRRL